MEPPPQPPQPVDRDNWFDRHKGITCFSIVVLFFLSFALFNRNPNETTVQGASTALPTATPTLLPTDTPTPTETATPPPTAVIVPIHQSLQTTPPSATQEQGLSNKNDYINSSGDTVHSPASSTDGSVPAGATAKCADGTYSFSQHHSGTCSHHGGVAEWL